MVSPRPKKEQTNGLGFTNEPTARAAAACLIALSLVTALLRLHTYHEPFERDLNYYAVIAHEMVNGRSLYSEVVDHKPPGIHATYALAELLVGYGKQQMYALGVCAALLTLFGVYAAALQATKRRSLGILSSTVWALVCNDLLLQANQPNSEVFINACLVWAFALLLQLRGPQAQWKTVSVIGLLFLLASLYKQTAIVPAAILCGMHLLARPSTLPFQRAALQSTAVAMTGVIGWLALIGYFWAKGQLGVFSDWVFGFNQHYAGSILENLWLGLEPEIFFRTRMMWLVPALCIIAVLGATLRIFQPDRRTWTMLLAWAVGTYCSVALPGKFFPHYYQYWLPIIAVAFGLSVHGILKARGRVRWAGLGLAAIVIVGIGVTEVGNFRYPARTWSQIKYGSDLFLQSHDLGVRIDQMLLPEETFYEWGAEPGLYFASGRRPVTGVIASWAVLHDLSGAELGDEMTRRTMDDLSRASPDLIVVSDQMARATDRDHPFWHWLRQHYTPFARTGAFYLFARKSSALETRVTPLRAVPGGSAAR